jgi:hypothetical protein
MKRWRYRRVVERVERELFDADRFAVDVFRDEVRDAVRRDVVRGDALDVCRDACRDAGRRDFFTGRLDFDRRLRRRGSGMRIVPRHLGAPHRQGYWSSTLGPASFSRSYE